MEQIMEKCKNCQWNKPGMICPEQKFCGKSLAEHDNTIKIETISKTINDVKMLIIDTPSTMNINGQNYFSEHELAIMLQKLTVN